MWPGKCFTQTFIKSNCVLPSWGADNLHRTAEPIPRMSKGSTHVRALLSHLAPIKQISSSLQGQGRWPIAPGGYPGTGVRAAFQKKWVIGELWRQTRDLQTWARFGGEPPNWWALYTSVAWWAANSCQTRLVGTGLKKARKQSSGEFCHEERCHEVTT